MGKLFDSIKKNYNELIKFNERQEKNYLKETNFNNLLKAKENMHYVNYFMNELVNNSNLYFGSYDNYKKFLSNNNLFPKYTANLPNIGFTDIGKIKLDFDYEAIFNAVEETIGEKKTDALIKKIGSFDLKNLQKEIHPFDKLTKDLISSLDELNILDEDKLKYIDTLNFFNEELIGKRLPNYIDDLVDPMSLARDTEAKKKLKEYGDSIGLDGDKLSSKVDNLKSLGFSPDKTEDKEFLKYFINHEPKYNDEFKQKIIALDKLITEKGLIPNGTVGETDYKEYGFIDYFVKADEVKNLVLNQNNLTTAKDKIANLEQIHQAANELKDITNKYNEVIDFIKDNFDLNKIILPGNVYSGRAHEFKNLEGIQNLPKRWDHENAAYGIILNGFSQLKGAAQKAGVSIEEYLNNPIKSYLKGAKEVFKAEDDLYILPRENNSLGKRIAHILVMNEDAYKNNLIIYDKVNRGIEFLNTASDLDENTLNNIISSSAGISLFRIYDHSSDNLFYDNRKIDYQSLQNLFVLGNQTDNLFEVSNNYFDDKLNKGVLGNTYDQKLGLRRNVNPLNETRRVMETLKEFMIERNVIYRENQKMEDKITPASMFVAAKKYMNDFIYKNNINLLTLDKKTRKEVFDFLENPVQLFYDKYQDDPDILLKNSEGVAQESFNSILNQFKNEHDRLHKADGLKFVEAFNDLNNKTNGSNANKNIQTILNDNKGGYWERKFGSTSKEYKALESSFLAATTLNSPTFGDLTGVKVYAQKYLDHKLPAGARFEKLSENEKRRVEFCTTIIGAALKIEFDKQNENQNNNIAQDNNIFQNKLKEDIDLGVDNNNIIIEDNEIENNNIIAQEN